MFAECFIPFPKHSNHYIVTGALKETGPVTLAGASFEPVLITFGILMLQLLSQPQHPPLFSAAKAPLGSQRGAALAEVLKDGRKVQKTQQKEPSHCTFQLCSEQGTAPEEGSYTTYHPARGWLNPITG